MKTTQLRLGYPIKGISFSPALSAQKETSPGALNARSFSTNDDSATGGTRFGTSKWHSAQMTGASHNVQDVNSVVTTI